jgi:hypothetical protein
MNPDQFRHIVALAGETFNTPPAQVPREEMWNRIRLARDYNRHQVTAPRETIWNRLATLRAATRPAPFRKRAPLTGALVSERDVRVTASRRSHVAWMLATFTSLAAVAVFASLQTPADPQAGAAAASAALPDGSASSGISQYAFQPDGISRYASDFAGGWVNAVADDPVSEAYRRAATIHLKRSDVLLAGLRTLSDEAIVHRNMRATIRELLSNTRLLLNSPATIQAQYRGVFLDLELVLIRMSVLTPSTVAAERAQIEETLVRKKLLARMRDLIPVVSTSNAN